MGACARAHVDVCGRECTTAHKQERSISLSGTHAGICLMGGHLTLSPSSCTSIVVINASKLSAPTSPPPPPPCCCCPPSTGSAAATPAPASPPMALTPLLALAASDPDPGLVPAAGGPPLPRGVAVAAAVASAFSWAAMAAISRCRSSVRTSLWRGQMMGCYNAATLVTALAWQQHRMTLPQSRPQATPPARLGAAGRAVAVSNTSNMRCNTARPIARPNSSQHLEHTIREREILHKRKGSSGP